MLSLRTRPIRMLVFAIAACAAAGLPSTRASAEATILVDVETGKVLHAENATVPWYPASITKIMTTYVTLRAIKEGRITLDTLFTVSPNAAAQAPVKMGFPVGTQVTVDNALKMLLVKSANDIAVLIAEGVGGSIEGFADLMNRNAQRLGMTQSSFVNPNGLPADDQIVSARDMAILARAAIREFPEYDYLWHLPGFRFGKKVVHNYNTLLGRYAGTDGMKTGFICASGFNLVATATRDNKRLIAVVLGAPSGAMRAVKAAQLLERGFNQGPLGWLTPSLGQVEALQPVNTSPPNLREEMCGNHRKKPATEDEEDVANIPSDSAYAVFLSSLRAPSGKNANLLQDLRIGEPVPVYTGPTKTQAAIAAIDSQSAAKPAKSGAKAGTKTAAKTTGVKPATASTAATPWNSLSPKPLAHSPPDTLNATPAEGAASTPVPTGKPKAKTGAKPAPKAPPKSGAKTDDKSKTAATTTTDPAKKK